MRKSRPYNKRQAAIGSRMGKKFIARTATGLIVDRDYMQTPQGRQNRQIKNKPAPDGLAKFFRPIGELYA